MIKIIWWFCVAVIAAIWILLLSIGGWKTLLVGVVLTVISIVAGCCETYLNMKEKDDAEKDV